MLDGKNWTTVTSLQANQLPSKGISNSATNFSFIFFVNLLIDQMGKYNWYISLPGHQEQISYKSRQLCQVKKLYFPSLDSNLLQENLGHLVPMKKAENV